LWLLDQAKMVKLVLAVNVGFLAAVVAVTLAALHGRVRLLAVGVLCAALTIGMYAAPLGAMVSCSDRDHHSSSLPVQLLLDCQTECIIALANSLYYFLIFGGKLSF